MPGYQPIMVGSLVVCERCAEQGAPPLIPRWLLGRHEAWHARQDAGQQKMALPPKVLTWGEGRLVAGPPRN